MLTGTFEEMERKVLAGEPQPLALAGATGDEAVLAVSEAVNKSIISGILVGPKAAVHACCEKNSIDPSNFEIVDAADARDAAAKAVALVREGRAKLLMKGLLETSEFLHVVLSGSTGIRTEKRLCSTVAIECKAHSRILVLGDVGTNIAPSVEDRASIIESLAVIAKAFGATAPKVAALCAHEHVQREAMPCTAEAALLAVMGDRGQIKGNVIIDGPISMDLAVSEHAARIKKYGGHIQGDADILLAPNLEVGNILIKALMYLTSDIRIAGVGMGARVPLVLTSRGDDHDAKYYSIVLASLISQTAV
jgi:phosphate butyryltransferase